MIIDSLWSMAFPGLYNDVAHVSTEPTTVPTAYTRTTYTYLFIYCCMYVPSVPITVPAVRTRTIPTAVQYVLPTGTRTNCTADVGTFTY